MKMVVNIISKDEKPLLSRVEIHAQCDFAGKPTPSKSVLRKDISSSEKVDESLVVIKHVFTRFGESIADILAYVYTDKDVMVKIDLDAKKQAAIDAELAKKAAEEKAAADAKAAEEKAAADTKAAEENAADTKTDEEKSVEPSAEEKSE